MTDKTKASGQETGYGTGSYYARLAQLTKKEWAYRYAGLAAKDFAQGFQMLSLCLMYLRSHVKKSTIAVLFQCRDWVLGLVPLRVRKSPEPPVSGENVTPNAKVSRDEHREK